MTDLFSQPPNSSALAAQVILDELTALGVTDIVVCPGSRSAPLAYAAWEFEAAGRTHLYMRVDERSAGFFALGLAKSLGRAVAVVTTSGTAVANLAPALAEARHSYVPLIALTADRPSTLIGTGANQTTDQVGIFGTLPRLVVRIAGSDLATDAWRASVRRAVVAAEGRLNNTPGPVHINVELTDPLIGDAGVIPSGVPFQTESRRVARPVNLDPGPRTVIIAGDMPYEQGSAIAQEAQRANVPLLAEPSSNARSGSTAISTYRFLLPWFTSAIERVVIVGHPTLSRPVMNVLARRDIEIVAVTSNGEWVDPGWAVSRVTPAVSIGLGDPAWLTAWKVADASMRTQMDSKDGTDDGPRLAAQVLMAMREKDCLVVGASSPIRDLDIAPIHAHSPRVFANRGLGGIDGTIATAMGIATGTGAHTVAYIGDITALHDISSLAIPALERTPDLTLVVADDCGGSIFSTLEYGADRSIIGGGADGFERLFAVPHKVDFVTVAAGFGCKAHEVELADVAAALRSEQEGLTVLTVSIDRESRRGNDAQWNGIAKKVSREVLSQF